GSCMKKESRFIRKTGHKLISVSAASVLLLASQAFAQGEAADSQAAQRASQEFQEYDQNRDQRLSSDEIDAGMQDRLDQAGLERDQVLQEYDRNRDEALDENEYLILVTTLDQQQSQDTDDAQVVMESQQP